MTAEDLRAEYASDVALTAQDCGECSSAIAWAAKHDQSQLRERIARLKSYVGRLETYAECLLRPRPDGNAGNPASPNNKVRDARAESGASPSVEAPTE